MFYRKKWYNDIQDINDVYFMECSKLIGLTFSYLPGIVFERMTSIKIERVLNITHTQDEDSGHRTPQDPAEKMRESHRILHKNTGKRWNMEAVFRPEIVRAGLFDLGIYHLNIPDKHILNRMLIQFVNQLPDLITLKIHSILINDRKELPADESVILHSIKKINKFPKFIWKNSMMFNSGIYFSSFVII